MLSVHFCYFFRLKVSRTAVNAQNIQNKKLGYRLTPSRRDLWEII